MTSNCLEQPIIHLVFETSQFVIFSHVCILQYVLGQCLSVKGRPVNFGGIIQRTVQEVCLSKKFLTCVVH